MTPHFIFPASPLNPSTFDTIDETFRDEAAALKQAGFGTSVINPDTGNIVGTLPDPDADYRLVYRGWMMDAEEYTEYYQWINGLYGTPLTTPEQYLAAHHLPNWYPKLAAYTPETAVFPSGSFPEPYPLDDELRSVAAALGQFVRERGWAKFQLKDYVKSLKTAGGSASSDPGEIAAILENMRKYRGGIEGGLVLRRWEDFYPGSERRYFVLNDRYYSQEGAFDTRAMRILARVHHLVQGSPFYSVDIAQPVGGDEFRLVEIGDGQVSDLVGWTPERFAEIWRESCPKM
jgi:ATP-grasp domain, R2K clade family 3